VVKTASLEIHQNELAFSAGHFTIFSATEREQLHGHNYQVSVAFQVEIGDNGLAFDYRYYKKKLQLLCDTLNSRFILPAHSPYLTIEETADYWIAAFNHKKIPFLKEDVIILPITNATIEELSHWFLAEVTMDTDALSKHRIQHMTIKVFNGPGQSGGASWMAPGSICLTS